MDIERAIAAGVLATKITELQKVIEGLQGAQANGVCLAGMATFTDLKAGGNFTMTFPSMHAKESASMLDLATEVFKNRLAGLQSELEAL